VHAIHQGGKRTENDVFLTATGMTRFGKRSESLEDLFLESYEDLVERALSRKLFRKSRHLNEAIDALYVGSMNPEEFTGEGNIATLIADHLGLAGRPTTAVETASSTGLATFFQAYLAVRSGVYKRVLAVVGEKMTALPTSAATRILAEVIHPLERACGASMPALAAMSSRRYAYEYELSMEELRKMLAAVSIKNHKNALDNPFAQFHKKISLEKYLSSKVISTPLCLYDCAAISDGAVAALISSDPGPVRISGLGQAGDTLALCERDSFTSFSSTILAADAAYKMADLSPKDIDVAAIHDAFTMFEIVGTEDLGFFPPGKGGYAVLDGLTDVNGSIPVNPCGGLKGRGHPVGASGLAQIHEIYRLLLENPGWDIGITQSIGGLANNNLVCILEKVGHGKRVFGYNAKWLPREVSPHHAPHRHSISELFGLLPSRRGRIATFTTLYTVPEGFEEKELRLAIAEIRGGHYLMGIMLSPEEEYGIDTRVRVVPIEDRTYFEVR